MFLDVSRPGARSSLLAAILGLALVLAPDFGAALPKDQTIVFKAGQTTALAYGRLSKSIQEVYFAFYAHTGDHLRVEITPLTRELITAGVVISPSGEQDGGPGGVVFDSELKETGRYRLRVTQRFNDISGKFRVLLEISPKEKDTSK
jgi:hypothetical protein